MARRPHDFYETPEHYVNQILPLVDERDFVYEPCVGDGAISHFFPRVLTNDIDLAREADRHYDATTSDAWPVLSYPVDWIITNPPFNVAFEILQHAVRYAPNVAMLLRISFFEPTKQRGPWLRAHPPDGLIYLPRYSFTSNGKSDSTTCVWGLWTKDRLLYPEPIRIAPRFPTE